MYHYYLCQTQIWFLLCREVKGACANAPVQSRSYSIAECNWRSELPARFYSVICDGSHGDQFNGNLVCCTAEDFEINPNCPIQARRLLFSKDFKHSLSFPPSPTFYWYRTFLDLTLPPWLAKHFELPTTLALLPLPDHHQITFSHICSILLFWPKDSMCILFIFCFLVCALLGNSARVGQWCEFGRRAWVKWMILSQQILCLWVKAQWGSKKRKKKKKALAD